MRGLTEICFCVLSLLHLTCARYINHGNNVFIYDKAADMFLSRSLLYNSWDFELITPGNLERECIEEVCSYEEAREVFEDDQKTQDFWKKYTHSSGSSVTVDVPGLVSGIVAAVIIVVIATVLGCYCYHNRGKSTRQAGSDPVQMAADARPAPELVPLSSINVPGLPTYNEALDHSGHYDAPPPPYTGETPSAPPEPQANRLTPSAPPEPQNVD